MLLSRSKALLLALCALILVVGIVPAFAQDDVSGTLNILGFTGTDEIATTRLDYFREQYPNVELAIAEGGLDEQQFLTAVASGSPPDLVYLGRDVLSSYAVRGALQPLTECIANQEIDMSQYRPAAVAEVTVDDVVYGIPEFFNIILMIANRDALEAAGYDPATLNTTDWDAVAEMNTALTRMDGSTVTRIGFDPKLPEFFPLWAMANGVSLLSEDGRTAQLNSPEAVEALEFAVAQHEPAGGRQNFMAFRDTWDFFGAGNQMAADQLGAFPMEQWYVNSLAGTSPDAPLVFAPFTDREGNPISFATGNSWAIPTGAANPEAACAFMKAVTSVDAWTAAAQARADLRAEAGTINTGTYSGNLLADEAIFDGGIVGPTGSDTFDAAIQTILDISDAAFTIPPNPAANEFKQAWTDAVNRVLNGEQTAQEALDQAQAEAQAALDDAWSRQD